VGATHRHIDCLGISSIGFISLDEWLNKSRGNDFNLVAAVREQSGLVRDTGKMFLYQSLSRACQDI